MRNAALILGLIGSLIMLVIGFFSYLFIDVSQDYAQVSEIFGSFEKEEFVRWASVLGPIIGIAGAAMARARALWGGLAMLVSTALMYGAFGINPFTLFPIAMVGLAGILALAAGRPDKEVSHF